jgi:hypothetical protein
VIASLAVVEAQSGDVLAPYRAGPPYVAAAPDLPLRCPMCGRRLGEVTFVHGRMVVIRASMVQGIPVKPRVGRHATVVARRHDGRPSRRPKYIGDIYVNETGDRWRFWCVHKQRGPLDRTITAETLERLYVTALETGAGEVVLP